MSNKMKAKKVSTDIRLNLLELAKHLRKEHIFVSNEKIQIQKLNEKVLSASSRLFNTSWISREQRFNLERLISHGNTDLLNCCNTSNRLECVHFIDGYKKLGTNESIIAELFAFLRKNPNLLANTLMSAEKSNGEAVERISQIIMSSIYSHCILNEDQVFALQMMKQLITSQMGLSLNPRRTLRYNRCAFGHIYRIFCDEILDAKPFLTAALYEPVMQLLAEDDLFLDIDPNRAVVRFAPTERIRHFGKEGTQPYYENLQKYRIWTINKLAAFVSKFIEGIQQNIFCFPQSLSWIVKQLYNTVIKNKTIEVREIVAMCADLIFSFFICPAILNPDMLGITDAHVSHIARFNLQQIAQIIQILALSKWEEIDPKLDDLYSKFQKDSISRVLDHILEKCSDELPQESHHLQHITRSCVLISETELKTLLTFLNNFINETEDENMKKVLSELLERIPEKLFNESTEKVSSSSSANNSNSDNSPRMRRSILNRVTRKGRLTDPQKHDIQQSNAHNCETVNPSQTLSIDSQTIDVLIIPIGNSRECPGMLSEEKVLKMEQHKRSTKVRMNLDMLLTQNNEETESVVSAVSGSEKRTRFSLSQDQESIGTSDNLEAISEAASNHSVESSLDLENENDNMSDMVSANVSSGRGTPNVSGRDTPSSHSPNQSGESSDEEVEAEPMANPVQAPARARPPAQIISGSRVLNAIPITQPNRPNNRDDIEDKFGKFDIKPVAAVDETKSMLSDTWSTDVLGSDSEAFEQTETVTNPTITQTTGMNMLGFPVHQSHALQSVLDSSETASQSDAWSTDVLTSDTERLQEFDPEDSASVTRSEPDDENINNMYEQQYNIVESPKNGTIKQRNIKTNANSSNNISNLSQEMSETSVSTNIIVRSKSSFANSSNALKTNSSFNMNRIENERKSHSESTLTENIDNCSDIFPISLSPTLLTHNMQSLGRLSFDVRKFDEDISVRNLIHDNVYANFKTNGIANNGSIVAELLSLDLSQQKTAKNANQELSNSLIDFEMEISSVEKVAQQIQTPFNSIVNSEPSNELINFSNDLLTEESLIQVTASSVESRYSLASLSSASSHSSYGNLNEINSNKVVANNVSKPFNKYESTGAIPKTSKPILTLNNRLQYVTNEDELNRHSNRKGFFKLSNFKSTFKEKMRSFKDNKRTPSNDESFDGLNDCQKSNEISLESNDNKRESSDDILDKYRAKPSQHNCNDEIATKIIFTDSVVDEDKSYLLNESEILSITKKKIRRVLGSIDLITFPVMMTERSHPNNESKKLEIMHILKVLLAEAINLRHTTHTVLLHEALRSIQSLDENSCQKLFWSLREDYQKRTVYIAYLTKCRQHLLSTLAYFESILEHIEREKSICSLNLVSISVKQFLEKKERSVQLFIKKFQSLVAADEKTQLVDKFLIFLFNTLNNDTQWQAANEEQIEMAKQVIERIIMSQIYIHAIYPNGDGDVLRDQILHQHIQNLSLIITPNHKDLGIPKLYHSESPWPSAQAEILAIGAYKTPRDKVKCVLKCCTNIMNLLSISSDKSVPAADDLMPVLVYVLIKANPPSLLSTVQYVNSFYDKHFEGEEAYWWTQFCSAIEFIKTMD